MKFMKPIDGSLALNDTKDDCEAVQLGGFKLNNIQFGTMIENGQTKLVNKADFDSANSTSILSTLNFLSVDDKTDGEITGIKESMKTDGWTLITDTHIYVQSNIRRVLVSGKP
jgi:hypothetical protein